MIQAHPVVFKNNKESYADKIIDYPQSPTGKAYVGINKQPFMKAAGNGYGFQGVLIQDENREKIQCHGCGAWVQKLTTGHVYSCSQLTTTEYKKKYGLNSDQGLVSDETSLRLTRVALLNKATHRTFGGKRGRGGTKKHSISFFNRYGTCPLQLKTRLYEFIRCNRELPSPGNRGKALYQVLSRRFGTYEKALIAHELPSMKRDGTNMQFTFSDGTIYKYNLNQFYDRQKLYYIMLDKCPVLSETK
jgi:hypothetical protein